MSDIVFYHLRLKQLNENLDAWDLAPGGRMTKNVKTRVIGNRAVTLGFFVDEDGLLCVVGAPCTWKDNFSRKKGREYVQEYAKDQCNHWVLGSMSDFKTTPVEAIEYELAGSLRRALDTILYKGHSYIKVAQLQNMPKINVVHPQCGGWGDDIIDFVRDTLMKQILAWRKSEKS